MIFHTFITICASHLCCGSDSFPQISSSLRADNGPSECSLLQNESTLIVQTCNPHLHKSICSISKGTTPPLSTSSPPAPDEWQSGAACRRKCHTNCCLHVGHYRDPHGGLMRSRSVARGHFEVSAAAFPGSVCVSSPGQSYCAHPLYSFVE